MSTLNGYMHTVIWDALARRREERERQKRISRLKIEIAHLEAVRNKAIKQIADRSDELAEVRRG